MVFIDAQNMYHGARDAFGWDGHPGHFGNFRPLALGRMLTQDSDRRLEQIRVYTGVPTAARDRKGNAIQQRRIAAWVADAPILVEVFPRPLRYPPDAGREKGVDVELAIDMVELALDDSYDIAILASADTDLVPALQLVDRRCPEKTLETIAWEPVPECEGNTAAAIDIPGGGVKRRMLDHIDLQRLEDRRNFVIATTDPAKVVGKPRWDKISGRLRR